MFRFLIFANVPVNTLCLYPLCPGSSYVGKDKERVIITPNIEKYPLEGKIVKPQILTGNQEGVTTLLKLKLFVNLLKILFWKDPFKPPQMIPLHFGQSFLPVPVILFRGLLL